MIVHLVDELARATTRLLLVAAALGFGTAGWILVVHHRWEAFVATVLWYRVGRSAFLSIWNETDRSDR